MLLFNTKDKLLSKGNSVLWVTRVPETITEVKKIIQKDQKEFEWVDLKNGYLITPMESNYGGVKQRWMLVFSEKAYQNEINTVKLMIEKKEKSLKGAIKKFEKEIFYCEKDAEKAFRKFIKNHKIFTLDSEIKANYTSTDGKKGRQKNKEKVLKGHSVSVKYKINATEISKHENGRGQFLLGTNDFN